MIVVTGAAGFIAGNLVRALLKRGITDMLLVDRFPEDRYSAKYSNIEDFGGLERMDRDVFLEWFTEHAGEVSFVYHLGARTDTGEFDFRVLDSLNLSYSKALWEICTVHQIPMVYASSAATYGMGEHGFADDEATIPQLKPLNPYGESKLNFDIWALQQGRTPPLWMGLRFFNVYGPNEYYKQDMSSVVFKAFRQIGVNGALKLFRSHDPNYKDGEQLRDFVYVKDVTRWIAEIIFDGKGHSGIFNMGYGTARTWLALANSVFKELHKTPQIEWIDVPETLRPRYQYFTRAKMDRFLSMGFSRPQWPLEEGIKDYVTNYLNQPDPFF